MVKDHEARE